MSQSTKKTPYGTLDAEKLREAQQSFDTAALLRMVDEVDALVLALRGADGLREKLLRLHGMAHAVFNGVGLSAPTGENLPELAAEVDDELLETIEALRRLQPTLRVLSGLAATD